MRLAVIRRPTENLTPMMRREIGEFGEPFVFVDRNLPGGVQPAGSKPENEAGQVVEPAAYLFIDEFAGHCGDGAAKEDEARQRVAGHAVPPWGLSRARAGTGGRYCSLRAASWMRAAVTAAPVMV